MSISGLQIGGIVMIIISILVINSVYQEKQALRKGKVVKVFIQKVPDRCKTHHRGRRKIFFTYKGEIHSRDVNEMYCNRIEEGVYMQMKTNKRESEFVFLWEKESKMNGKIGWVMVFGLIGMLFLFRVFK